MDRRKWAAAGELVMRNVMACLLGLFHFGLLALLLTSATYAAHASGLTRPVDQPSIGMTMTKTVGIDANVCGATDQITVQPDTPVYPCYIVSNRGTVSLTLNLLTDSHLPPLPPFQQALAPGELVTLTSIGPSAGRFIFTPTASSMTTATIFAAYADEVTIFTTARARVDIAHSVYLPILQAPAEVETTTIQILP